MNTKQILLECLQALIKAYTHTHTYILLIILSYFFFHFIHKQIL